MLRDFFRYHWPLVFFLLAAMLVTAFSLDYPQSIRVQSPFVSGVACYVLIVLLADNRQRLLALSVVLPIVVLLALAYILPQAMEVQANNPLAQVKMLNSVLLVVPNDVLVLSVVTPLLLGVAWSGGWWLRGLFVCYLLVALAVGVAMQSRQTVFLLLFGQVAVVALMRPRWALLAALAGVVLAVLVDGVSGWALSRKVFLFPRTYVWHAAWEMFLDRPFTGQGPGLFKDIYFKFLGKAGYAIDAVSDRRPMYWAHNLYLEQLAERGVIGLLALASVLGMAARNACAVWRASAGNDATRSLAACVLASILVLAIAGIAEATLSRLWVVFSLLCLSAFSVALVRHHQS